jgi:uncharacterized membrane protein YqhA
MKKLLGIRYIFIIGIIFTGINSLFFLVGSVIEAIHGYQIFFEYGLDNPDQKPGVYLLKSLDMFLVSMVFLIFALGILRIFILNDNEEEKMPGWLHLANFKDLKVLLWETILVTLVVFTFTEVVSAKEILKWQTLIMPGVILLLTLSLAIMKMSKKD